MILLLLIAVVVAPHVQAVSGGVAEARLKYRTADRMTTTLGYDAARDTVVELVRLPSGKSMARRVTAFGDPGEPIWVSEREAFCPGGLCGIELEFSEKLDGYVLQIVGRHSTSYLPMVYFVPGDGGSARLLARSVIQPRPGYPEKDVVEPGVLGFDSIRSVTVAHETGEILVSGIRNGDGEMGAFAISPSDGRAVPQLEGGAILGKTVNGYFVSPGSKARPTRQTAQGEPPAHVMQRVLTPVTTAGVTKVVRAGNRRAELHAAVGELYLFDAAADAAPLRVRSSAKLQGLAGCGSDTPQVTGVWATTRGTLMVAVGSRLALRKEGKWVYGGTAHCLYEIE